MNDQYYMMRAIELARRAAGHTSPNPMVGAVVVSANYEILGDGYHKRCGEAHAEVNAIEAAEACGVSAETFSKSTIYVTLEPCSHHGRTAPCADLIIKKKIGRVVVGCVDPYEKVSGRGIEKLRAAGVVVEVGVCQSECRELNKRFITAQTEGRPYVTLKWAQSSDGFLDIVRSVDVPPAWFTGDKARKIVHQLRATEDAIIVGRRTAELDNPSLTVREVEGRNPLRVVLDRNGVLRDDLHLFDNEAATLVFSAFNHSRQGAEVQLLDYSQPIVSQVLDLLHKRNIQSLVVEGGAVLLNSFIESGLWDEAWVFTAPHKIAHYYPKIANPQGVAAPLLPKMEDCQGRVEMVEEARLEIFSRSRW